MLETRPMIKLSHQQNPFPLFCFEKTKQKFFLVVMLCVVCLFEHKLMKRGFPISMFPTQVEFDLSINNLDIFVIIFFFSS